jgi:hypothetical protein
VKTLATIAARAAEANLPFLVIGGNAVIAYGHIRQTGDIDLLVRQRDRLRWDQLILSLGYRVHHAARAFHMYHPTGDEVFPVDLMIVDDPTFEKLASDAQANTILNTDVRIPSLRHLIALKLHALRYGGEHRHLRDLGDVVALIRENHVDLASEEYREILDRYATDATRDELRHFLAGPQSPDP